MSAEKVIERVREGGVAIVTDDPGRENEGDLIMAADAVTPDKIGFFLQHTSGVICVALDRERCEELRLPLMIGRNTEAQGTAFTVSTDASTGITTGISADDRARTIQLLSSPESTYEDFDRPGHVFPLQARRGGVLKRSGHTEAALDVARLAGHSSAGVLCEVTAENKRQMADATELRALAARHDLPSCSIVDLVSYRYQRERLVELCSTTRIRTAHGIFTCYAWRSLTDGSEHLALVCGHVETAEPVLVRMHSECLTGDVFGSERCDCGTQLDDAMRRIAGEGRGVVVYLRGHEGRGIGLAHKIAAYNLQEAGHDTVDANLLLGLPVDDREYGIGAQIIAGLGVREIRLMTNNPAKYASLAGYGLEIVERVALPTRVTADNLDYLRVKRDRMGHLIASDALPKTGHS